LFESIIEIVFQNIFCLKFINIYIYIFFLKKKIIYDISISKRLKNTKIFNFKKINKKSILSHMQTSKVNKVIEKCLNSE